MKTVILGQMIGLVHGCSPRVAMNLLESEMMTVRHRVLNRILPDRLRRFNQEYLIAVGDLFFLTDLTEINVTLSYWRKRCQPTNIVEKMASQKFSKINKIFLKYEVKYNQKINLSAQT